MSSNQWQRRALGLPDPPPLLGPPHPAARPHSPPGLASPNGVQLHLSCSFLFLGTLPTKCGSHGFCKYSRLSGTKQLPQGPELEKLLNCIKPPQGKGWDFLRTRLMGSGRAVGLGVQVGDGVWEKTTFAPFMCVCHTLVILPAFHTFHYYLTCYDNL